MVSLVSSQKKTSASSKHWWQWKRMRKYGCAARRACKPQSEKKYWAVGSPVNYPTVSFVCVMERDMIFILCL